MHPIQRSIAATLGILMLHLRGRPLQARIGDSMLKIAIPITCLIFTLYLYMMVTVHS
jgi:hypothetical protein